MGTKPTNSAVDPRGRVWGTESLYIADAVRPLSNAILFWLLSFSTLTAVLTCAIAMLQSVFPTSSGVNPMITTMATSHSIAQFIDQDLRSDIRHTAEARL